MLRHYNSRLYDAFITPQGIINFMAMDAMDSQSLSDCWLWHIIFMSFCSPLRSLGGLLMWCIKLYSMHANTWKQWSKESQIKHVTIFTYHTPQLRLSLRDTCHNFHLQHPQKWENDLLLSILKYFSKLEALVVFEICLNRNVKTVTLCLLPPLNQGIIEINLKGGSKVAGYKI